ncbi:hypothetical protein Pcinc_001282 [Petrolisthes cinctipes]|uniref:Uncharacterized protein n=1 Tax=Petrolisthes cinctipes TaxID=88211 RepID=A0AAE1GL33_PETCI|nr:hypothetical protein Pcinc_001282 [Petrolisthes cinctipes]
MVPTRLPPDLDLTSDLLTTSDYQQKTTEREVLTNEVTENSLSYEESVKGVSEALGILVKAHLEENLKVVNKSLSQEWLVNLINVNTTPITTTPTPSHSPHAHTPSYTLLTTTPTSSHSPHAHVTTHTPRTTTPTPSHSPHAHKHKASIRHDHFHSIYSALVTLMRGTTAEGTEGDRTHRNRVEGIIGELNTTTAEGTEGDGTHRNRVEGNMGELNTTTAEGTEGDGTHRNRVEGNIGELNTTTAEGDDEGEARAPQFTRTPRTTTRKDKLLKTNTDEGADDIEFLEHLHDEGAPNPHPQQAGTPTYDPWKVKEALYSLSDAVNSDPEAALHIMLRFGGSRLLQTLPLVLLSSLMSVADAVGNVINNINNNNRNNNHNSDNNINNDNTNLDAIINNAYQINIVPLGS